MTTRIEPEIFSREFVKPSSTGFDHPKSHTLSYFDELQQPHYVSFVCFYANGDMKTELPRSDVLKKHLSAVLSLYYPLAGRRNSNSLTIDCNDEGALFLEAKISCSLSEVLKNRSLREDTVNKLFPDGLKNWNPNLGSPLEVQANYFDCGGMAIGISISHCIVDMSSICCFLNNWASSARKSCVQEEMARPEFNFATLYSTNVHPPANHTSTNKFLQFKPVKRVSRSFVFDGAKIAKLKAAAEKEMGGTPTRLEVVQALLFKCLLSAAARAKSSSGLIKPATMNFPINLRTRVRPPLTESATGNFSDVFKVSVSREEISKLEWIHLAGKIRNEKSNYLNELAKNCRGEEVINFIQRTIESTVMVDQDVYSCINWVRFPLYDADFGWGKPCWVTPARLEFLPPMINVIHMLDAKEGDGIEVLVHLEEQHLSLFESDEELLEFATVI